MFPPVKPPEVVKPKSMAISAPIPAVEVLSATAAPVWREVGLNDLSTWNQHLLNTDASIHQYPFWNEPSRLMGVRPRYLVATLNGQPVAFTSVLTLGFGPVKIGLTFRGPVFLDANQPASSALIQELLNWARGEGYIFLRFTHSDPEVLAQLASAGRAEDLDAFPYMLDYSVVAGDYIVPQLETEEETLAGFDREARRKIRRGAEAGYTFHSDDSPEGLARLWPMFRECAHRKRFRIERPLAVYAETMRLAQRHDRVRIYTACLHREVVGAAVIFRDRTTAHCLLAAFTPDHRQSASFLHWNAMRDMYRLGARRYNMGPGPKSLARFKRTFAAAPVMYPRPLTVVLKEGWFGLWRKGFIPMAKQLQPVLRQVAFHRARWAGERTLPSRSTEVLYPA